MYIVFTCVDFYWTCGKSNDLVTVKLPYIDIDIDIDTATPPLYTENPKLKT